MITMQVVGGEANLPKQFGRVMVMFDRYKGSRHLLTLCCGIPLRKEVQNVKVHIAGSMFHTDRRGQCQIDLEQGKEYTLEIELPEILLKKEISVWLDDERPMPVGYTHWAKTGEEAIELLKTGQVTCISLDHDLGLGITGYDVAKWIEQEAIQGTLPLIRCRVHTQNPVGKANIKMALRNAVIAWAS